MFSHSKTLLPFTILLLLHAVDYTVTAAVATATVIPTADVDTTTFDPNLMCSLIANGTTIKDPRACNTWIECINGTPVLGTCDDDLFYDRASQSCVPPDTISCFSTNPCAATAGVDGFVADPYSCNGYYYCSNGHAALGYCSSGLNFNPGTQDCIRNFPCVQKMDPNSFCNIVPDGIFIKESNSCSDYELCWKGAIIDGSCSNGFYFNAATGVCDYQRNVVCNVETTTLPNRPVATEVCTAAGEFVTDDLTCNGYYLCREMTDDAGVEVMELQHGVCPTGRFFNPANGGSCIARTQIVCAYDRCAGMGLTYIQLANLSDDDCEGYAICQDGVTIGTGLCPQGEYFNEVTQLCTTTAISYPACVLSPKSSSLSLSSLSHSTTTTETTTTVLV